MTNSQRNFVKILSEICNELKIGLKSYCGDWVFELQNNNKKSYIVGYEFPLDISSTKKLVDDKSALSDVLSSQQIDCVKHVFFMNPKNCFYNGPKDWKNKIIKQFINFNYDCVIKPNNGTSGQLVYHVKNKFNLIRKTKKIFRNGFNVSICEFESIGNEYRVIILKKEIVLIYEKIRQNSWKHNLFSGAKVNKDISDEVKHNLSVLVEKIINIIDINFCSIDIINVNQKYMVIEINSGVMLEKFSSFSQENYDIAKSIYKKAILYVS